MTAILVLGGLIVLFYLILGTVRDPDNMSKQYPVGNLVKTSFDKPIEFLSYLKGLSKKFDWDVNLPLTMASLETGYGRSCYYYNLFNITTYSDDTRFYFKYPSIADLKFRKYKAFPESVQHFWDLINNKVLYPEAYNLRHNAQECIKHLIYRGYAGPMTDPARYLKTLKRIEGMIF